MERPERFPGNTNSYPGTTLQSVIRCLINRLDYLQGQVRCKENAALSCGFSAPVSGYSNSGRRAGTGAIIGTGFDLPRSPRCAQSAGIPPVSIHEKSSVLPLICPLPIRIHLHARIQCRLLRENSCLSLP